MKGINFKKITNPLTTLKELPFIKTHTVLDELFGGGLKRGQLVEVYGQYASGKTQLVKTLVVEVDGKVLYVDSEFTFSGKRIMEIAEARGKTIKDIDEKILLVQPENWKEQMAIFHQLPKDMNDVNLIVVDSLMKYFREEEDFIGRQHLPTRQSLVRLHLARLKSVARKYNCVVIVTNQVVAKPDAGQFTPVYDKETGAGGNTVWHVPDTRIYFRKFRDPKRIARLMDSSELPPIERVFILGKKGIEDVPKKEEKPKEEVADDKEKA